MRSRYCDPSPVVEQWLCFHPHGPGFPVRESLRGLLAPAAKRSLSRSSYGAGLEAGLVLARSAHQLSAAQCPGVVGRSGQPLIGELADLGKEGIQPASSRCWSAINAASRCCLAVKAALASRSATEPRATAEDLVDETSGVVRVHGISVFAGPGPDIGDLGDDIGGCGAPPEPLLDGFEERGIEQRRVGTPSAGQSSCPKSLLCSSG